MFDSIVLINFSVTMRYYIDFSQIKTPFSLIIRRNHFMIHITSPRRKTTDKQLSPKPYNFTTSFLKSENPPYNPITNFQTYK